MSKPLKQETLDLMKAKALIERGWTQHVRQEGEAVCAVRAIELATGGRVSTARYFFREAIGREDICGWNDEEDRTKEQVVAAFAKAAELSMEE